MKRNGEDIWKVLYALETIWAINPHLRLGQLLVDAVKVEKPCPELFYVEDNDLIEKLKRFSLDTRTLPGRNNGEVS